MQSFKTSYNSPADGGDNSIIQFAPYQAANLTRAFVIHNDVGDLTRTERIISSLPGFCLIGWQMNRNVALKDIIQLRPELIIVYSPCISSLDFALARALKEEVPSSNLIFLSNESKSDLKPLMLAGSSGFCLTSENSAILSLAIQTVALGGVWIDPSAAGNVFDTKCDDSSEEPSPQLLSDRERQVLHLIAEGLTNQEIAIRLWLSRETIKSHVKKIMRKLSVKDRTQAAVAALRLGLSV